MKLTPINVGPLFIANYFVVKNKLAYSIGLHLTFLNLMATEEILHMNGGVGETSYVNNSSLQVYNFILFYLNLLIYQYTINDIIFLGNQI